MIFVQAHKTNILCRVLFWFTVLAVMCVCVLQAPVCVAAYKVLDPASKEYLQWEEQYTIVEQRYETVFLPLFQTYSWQEDRIQKPYKSIPADSLDMFPLKPDVCLEDFLFCEIGVTTREELYQAVGVRHMSCGSGFVGDVYLTADGYYIAYYFLPSHTSVQLHHAYIRHIDWEKSRDYEEFRKECLEQIAEQEKVQHLQQLLQWIILCGAVLICTVAAAALLLMRRK